MTQSDGEGASPRKRKVRAKTQGTRGKAATKSKRSGKGDKALALLVESPTLWFAVCGRILTKEQELVCPDPNLYQLRLLEVYEWAMKNGVPCRILALKPRQKGSSTVSSAIVYHHCRRFPTRALQIADRYKNSDNLFAMTNRYAEHDRFPWPTQWQANATSSRLVKGKAVWSRVDKDTAENPRAGRSGTLQVLHVSEAAHFPSEGERGADKTMLSLLNSLADVPCSVAIVETTANGTAGWFYEHWQKAVTFAQYLAGERGNGWIKVFAPWHEFDDSRLAISGEERAAIEASLTEREKSGRALFGWEAEQVAWRRWTVAQKCGGREELFDQEYPEDEVTAFQASGRPRFSRAGLTRLRAMLEEKRSLLGTLQREQEGEVCFEQHESGWAEIWEPPREGANYLIWCDTATGREQTRESRDPDRHSVLVLRNTIVGEDGTAENAMLVARIRPPCYDDWHLLEEKVVLLSLYYGRCLIGVEVPMGLTLLEGLRRAGMPLFKRRSGSGAAVTEHLGFQSNVATKPLIIASLSRALDRDAALDIYDPHTVAELGHFVIHEDGREAALPGKHDDDVMALAMAVHHLKLATPFRKRARTAKPADLHKWKPLHR